MSENKQTYSVSVSKKEDSQAEITGSIPWEEVERYRAETLKKYANEVTIDGFRKGSVPEKILLKHVGESTIVNAMAEKALTKAYPIILREQSLFTVGQPLVSVTKLAKDNPLEFKITTSLMPEVNLPDYKKIAGSVKKESAEVTEEDVESGIKHIREQWAKHEKLQESQKKGEQVDATKIEVSEDELPDLTDEFVKKLGSFTSVEDFRKKFEENLKSEKKMRERDRRRGKILEEITEKAEIELPPIIVDGELQKMMHQFEGDVAHAGLEVDDYLKQVEKTKEDLMKEWRPDAKKRAKSQLVLNSIAEGEKITADKDVVAKEVEKILSQYPDADRQNASVYVESIVRNEEVFKFLESIETS